MIVCLPVTADAQIGPSWGRADRVAVADVGASGIGIWEEFAVGWDQTHDAPDHDQHHQRIARFLTDHRVTCVVAGHMGPPMVEMLDRMGIGVRLGASGEARLAAIAARQWQSRTAARLDGGLPRTAVVGRARRPSNRGGIRRLPSEWHSRFCRGRVRRCRCSPVPGEEISQ